MNANDGGPAFPLTCSTGDSRDGVYACNGMTLRDWFAGQALVKAVKGSERTAEAIALRAYFIADAMLAQRAKEAK